MYHINDYHGSIAPLYLLPKTIPVALSLHNAEFQGLWPMRTPEESAEVCKAYNLDIEIVKKYVQYGSGKTTRPTRYLRVQLLTIMQSSTFSTPVPRTSAYTRMDSVLSVSPASTAIVLSLVTPFSGVSTRSASCPTPILPIPPTGTRTTS